MGGLGLWSGGAVGARRTTLDALGRLDVRRLQRQGYLDGQEHWLVAPPGRAAAPAGRDPRGWRPGGGALGRDRQRDSPRLDAVSLWWHTGPGCAARGVLAGWRCCISGHAGPVSAPCPAALCQPAHHGGRPPVSEGPDDQGPPRRQSQSQLSRSRPRTKPTGMHWRTWERLCAQEQAHVPGAVSPQRTIVQGSRQAAGAGGPAIGVRKCSMSLHGQECQH